MIKSDTCQGIFCQNAEVAAHCGVYTVLWSTVLCCAASCSPCLVLGLQVLGLQVLGLQVPGLMRTVLGRLQVLARD